ncbi:MAG TPA: PIG-L family deacetylase [Planctomycetota bacterium]|nr:PIG-L family deacetylase [Planctomycetota bacterium]
MAQDKLRIIAFGAHPDDCEYVAGGTAGLWAAKGHAVKFVACTNGDIGHHAMAGGPLARRRAAELAKCARILGIANQALDNHDGELLPTLENRKKVCTLIREWKADVVIGHRPNDYHPDHRYTGVLVQDAAYMVTVPFFCPDIPHLTHNPIFLYYDDKFLKPNPFTPDIAVAIDQTIEKKLDCFDALESQFYEGGCNATPDLVPKDAKGQAERRKKVREEFRTLFGEKAGKFRKALESRYGKPAAAKVKYAEAFEVCEYGRQPDEAEIRRLFPFFPK